MLYGLAAYCEKSGIVADAAVVEGGDCIGITVFCVTDDTGRGV